MRAFVILALAFVATAVAAPKKQTSSHSTDTGMAEHNPLFGYTHLLPSPYTLPQGTLVFGSTFAYGVFDFFEVGTDVIRDAYGFFNANGKLSIIDYPEFAMGLNLGLQTYKPSDVDPRLGDGRITSWQPGTSVAIALLPEVAWFVGGNLNLTNYDVVTDGVTKSGFVRGASLGSDLSWSYNAPGGKGAGNALSTGVTYDMTYKILGVGLSHHWPGFQLGFHYYLNADERRWLPILAGGGAVRF